MTKTRKIDADYFKNMEIEPLAYRSYVELEGRKKLFTFSESQKRLEKAGYERHLSLQEQNLLLILYFENKLPNHLKAIAEDMLKSFGEWTNQTYKTRKSGLIIFSEGVTRLDWNGKEHDEKTLELCCVTGVPISGLTPGKLYHCKDIHKKHESLIEYIYTKK